MVRSIGNPTLAIGTKRSGIGARNLMGSVAINS